MIALALRWSCHGTWRIPCLRPTDLSRLCCRSGNTPAAITDIFIHMVHNGAAFTVSIRHLHLVHTNCGMCGAVTATSWFIAALSAQPRLAV